MPNLLIALGTSMRKVRKLFLLLSHPVYRHGLAYGVGAAIEHTSFLKNEFFATVLDAGANKGQFALAARAHYPIARIVAFEPLPRPAVIFRKVFSTDANVSFMPIALGSTPGEEIIHVSGRADSSSLLPISALQSQTFPGTEEVGIQTIRVERLDGVLMSETLARPVLLKIDVQGFELELLKGAEQSLAHIDDIYVELSFVPLYDGQALTGDVTAWLRERGFVLAGVYNIAHTAGGRPVQADFHFRRLENVVRQNMEQA
jgi:FkbM family methyltransferase